MSRDDGSISVAIVINADHPDPQRRLEQIVTTWVEQTPTPDQLKTDLYALPRVEANGNDVLVVLDARPGARPWKDWLVSLTTAIQAQRPDVRAAAFRDLVGGAERPLTSL